MTKQKKIESLDKSLKKEKARTREKERVIDEFVNAVHKAYKNKNDDKSVEDLMSIYKVYVKDYTSEILDAKKKDPETIEELDRQLHYMNKAIEVLKASTAKIQKKTKANIITNRSENLKLINSLDQVRRHKLQLEQKKRELDLRIGELKLEKTQRTQAFENKLHEIHKKVNAQEDAASDEEKDKPVSTKAKGFLYKGTPFLRGNAEDKQKIQTLKVSGLD